MPNGHRDPFRMGDGSPSPLHTSDSEDTYCNKRRYNYLAKKVIRRWKAFTKQAKALVRALLPRTLPTPLRVQEVVETIVSFI